MTPTLTLALGWVVLVSPPQALPCGLPGWSITTPPDPTAEVIHAVRAVALPANLGIEIVPVMPGRIFCSGFEQTEVKG